MDNEDIVISGVGARLPECNNVEDFWAALFRGEDLITEDDRRFPPGYLGTPRGQGKILNPDKFDAAYFGINPKQANLMDCKHRVLLETTYECLVDAGYNPKELRGSRTGVYIGLSSETNDMLKKEKTDGYFNQSIAPTMAANKISFSFDFKGPSYTCDTACSSSYTAMVCALDDLKSGVVENAVVGAAHVSFEPRVTEEYFQHGMLAADAKCKTFSTKRDGFARSETVATVFLQKRNNCGRGYAVVLGGGINVDGYKKQGLSSPPIDSHINLMKYVQEQANIKPTDVTYFEAHGTGTTAGDLNECHAISAMLDDDRAEPLLIGSVKTNAGHAEIASGMVAMVKILGIAHTGVIPPNIHTECIDEDLPGIKEKKLRVVTHNTTFTPGIIITSALSFGGANAHLVVKPLLNERQNLIKHHRHRLVFASGRTVEAVNHFLDGIQHNKDDESFLTLVDEIHKMNVDRHDYRGYTVAGSKPIREIMPVKNLHRPLWFIYSGMGSQWLTMGKDLLKVDVFKKSFDLCANILKPYNMDLHHIVSSSDPAIFEDLTNSPVAITAIQIALTDLLASMEIIPDKIAGHSLGETACGYADGSLTREQAMLISYKRGDCCDKYKHKTEKCLMAAVGLPTEQMNELLPEGIYIACYNASNNVTIAGPENITKDFINTLKNKGVFVREVNNGYIGFHTKYTEDIAERLLWLFSEVIPNPKPRSDKWVSTSITPEQIQENWANLNCAEYHTNNFCNAVLFTQIYEQIPDNAIVIELAPHSLLQSILKKQLPQTVANIPLTHRGCEDGEHFLLSAIGKIYLNGYQPQLRSLYRKATLPVNANVKPISPLVKWDHSLSWWIPKIKPWESFVEYVQVGLHDKKYSHLSGYEIDGKIIVPPATYLMLAWKIFAKMNLKEIEDCPIKFQDVCFKRMTCYPKNEDLKFIITISPQAGLFEISEGGSTVATGTIQSLRDDSVPDLSRQFSYGYPTPNLTREEFYKNCSLSGYNYHNYFREIIECDIDGHMAKIEWNNHLECFLEGMMQMNTLKFREYRDLFLISFIGGLVIDLRFFLPSAEKSTEITVIRDKITGNIQSTGIILSELEFSKLPQKQSQANLLLETYEFIPYDCLNSVHLSPQKALVIALEIVLQNCIDLVKTLNIYEINNNCSELLENVKEILKKKPFVEAKYLQDVDVQQSVKLDIILLNEFLDLDLNNQLNIEKCLAGRGFLLYQGSLSKIKEFNSNIVFQSRTSEGNVYLLRGLKKSPQKYSVVNVTNMDFTWIEEIKDTLRNNQPETIYVISQSENTSGILGLVKCLEKESSIASFRAVFVGDDSESFSLDNPLFKNHLSKDLAINVLKQNVWGTYVHLPLENNVTEVKNARVEITSRDLPILKWIECPPVKTEEDTGEQVAQVHYAALISNQILAATSLPESLNTSRIIPEAKFCMEYSGISNNKKIMGLLQHGTLALKIKTDSVFTWDVPKHWSLEDAATVPLVYTLSYYALIVRGHLQPEESVLIHAGTGGIGLAAISIALSMGCKIFTTVNTQEDRNFLRQLFPQLKAENIGDSSSVSFKKMIMGRTNSKGVDVILNSLTGELFKASLGCLAESGRFLELENVNFINRTPIDSHLFLKNCSFHGILLHKLMHNSLKCKTELKQMVAKGIKNGVVKPLPRTVFEKSKIQDAFNYLTAAKGRVLVCIRENKFDSLQTNEKLNLVDRRIHFNPNKSYIIVGGTGGIGLEMTNWLIEKGAKKIILSSRRGISNGYQQFCLKKWLDFGATVVVHRDDSANINAANRLIEKAKKYGPVGGIFHLAAYMFDQLMINNTSQDFEQTFRSKFHALQKLDDATRGDCPHLDYFVVFSTLGSGLGNMGQTTYAMANSAVERLCEKRKSDNLPGLAIQYGQIAQVGILQGRKINPKVLKYTEAQLVSSCFEALETFMLQSSPVGASLILANRSNETTHTINHTPAEAVGHILGVNNLDNVDKSLTLTQHGLDSVTVSEIKQTLYSNYQIDVSIQEIQNLTFDQLMTMEVKKKCQIPCASAEVNHKDSEHNFNCITPPKQVIVLNKSFPEDANNIFVLHFLERDVKPTERWAKMLKGNVYELRCQRNCVFDTVLEFAGYYENLIRTVQQKGSYILCGYSYGVLVAFEVGKLLEKSGARVSLILIEDSPQYGECLVKSGFVKPGGSVDQRQILSIFSSTFEKIHQKKINDLIAASDDWNIQVVSVSKYISEVTKMSQNDVLASIDLLKKILSAICCYQSTTGFYGQCLIIRPEEDVFTLSKSYNLENLCPHVKVVKIKRNHNNNLMGNNTENVSDIVNEFLTNTQ